MITRSRDRRVLVPLIKILLLPFWNQTTKESALVSICFSSRSFAFFTSHKDAVLSQNKGRKPSLQIPRARHHSCVPNSGPYGVGVLGFFPTLPHQRFCALGPSLWCPWWGGPGPGGLADPFRRHQGCPALCLLVYLFSCYHQHT